MTLTTQNPERARRVADLWDQHPTWDEADVLAQVDADLAAEAEARAEQQAKANALVDSFDAMTSCGVCGEPQTYGAADGLCEKCRPVVAYVRAERRMAEKIRGRTRRELAGAYLDQKGT
jgi:hypothetical protein